MSISKEEWEDYEEYLETLSEAQLQIEIEWLKSVGIAKERGSTVASDQTDTLH
jgi:hypothetical protein